jgi:hypothetical protein
VLVLWLAFLSSVTATWFDFKDGQPEGVIYAIGCDFEGYDLVNILARGEDCGLVRSNYKTNPRINSNELAKSFLNTDDLFLIR